MIITKERSFYKLIFSIAFPIAIQNLITFAVSMIDTLMLGRLGEVELSAAAIANNLFFILMILMFGLAAGSNVLISQYWGKGDTKSIHKVLSIMYRLCVTITIIFVAIAMICPEGFVKIYTDDLQVIKAGAAYLRISAIGYIFYAITNTTVMVLRAVNTVRISLVIYSVSLVVNGFFNWVFIFGKLGAPELGVRGAAIATVIARIVEFSIVIGFMVFKEEKIKLRIKHLLKVDKIILKDYITNTTPILINELLWSTGATIISVIIGRLGTETVAANSINNVVFQFVTVFIFGMSSAAAVIIGNTIGRGEKEKVKEYARTIGVLSLILGVIASLLIKQISPFIVDFYNISENTKLIAMEIMSVTSVIVIFLAIDNNMMMGVLRGGGDAKFVLVSDLIFMWSIAIPFGAIAAFVLKLPITAVFFILKSDEFAKAVIAVIRVISGKWIRNVTRDFEEEA